MYFWARSIIPSISSPTRWFAITDELPYGTCTLLSIYINTGADVYGKPYSDWKDMVRSQPAGTKIRFMFARHSEFMKYQFDIIRRNVGDTGPSGGSAMPGGSAPPQAHEGSGRCV